MTKLVNNSNIDNLGENPAVFMDKNQKFLWNIQQENLRNKQIDILWEESQAVKESENLARVSGVIVTAWELQELLAKIPEGMSLVVRDGEIFIGRVSEERLGKMKKVGKRVARKTPSNLDTAEFEYKNVVSKSFANPATVAGFKHVWKTALRKAPKNVEFPLLNAFLDFIDEHPQNKVHWKIEQMGRQEFEVTISVEGLKTEITTNTYGRVLRYKLPNGTWVERFENRL